PPFRLDLARRPRPLEDRRPLGRHRRLRPHRLARRPRGDRARLPHAAAPPRGHPPRRLLAAQPRCPPRRPTPLPDPAHRHLRRPPPARPLEAPQRRRGLAPSFLDDGRLPPPRRPRPLFEGRRAALGHAPLPRPPPALGPPHR